MNSHKLASADFRSIISAIRLNWVFIPSGVILGALCGYFYSAATPKIWQGSFELYINDTNNAIPAPSSALSALSTLTGRSVTDSGVATHVNILLSNSLLSKAYNKAALLDSSLNKIPIDDDVSRWARRSIRIFPKKDTTIVQVSYKDADKSRIVPILNILSDVYQEYSNSDLLESTDSSLSYTQELVKDFRAKAEISNRELDEFRLKYGISGNVNLGNNSNLALGLIDDSYGSSSIASSLAGKSIGSPNKSLSDNSESYSKLADVTQELIRRRQQFTDSDPSVKRLLDEQLALKSYLRKTGGGIINLPDSITPTNSAQDVVLKYYTLVRRNDQIQDSLQSLESAYSALKISSAREPKPWKVISKPTVNSIPLTRSTKDNLLIGSTLGFLLGGLGSSVAPRFSRRLQSIYVASDFLGGFPFLGELILSSTLQFKIDFARLVNGVAFNAESSSIGFLFLSDFNERLYQYCREIEVANHSCNILYLRPTDDFSSVRELYLVASTGVVKASLIKTLAEIQIRSSKVSGWIWVDLDDEHKL